MGLTERICDLAELREKAAAEQRKRVDFDLLQEADWREFPRTGVFVPDLKKEKVEVKEVQEMKGKVLVKGLKDLDSIGEEIYLDFAKKSSLEMRCFACGENDKVPLGAMVYGISSLDTEDGMTEQFPTIFLCPRHFTDLAEQILLHAWRVGEGKEEGAIRLPLLKWKGEDE